MPYAKDTEVSIENSKADIERILRKFGADAYTTGWELDRAWIGFRWRGKLIKFVLPVPATSDERFTTYIDPRNDKKKERTKETAYGMWERECRALWRALRMNIYMKLEAVEVGIVTFEKEFLPYFVLPSGKTIAEELLPRLEEIWKKGLPGRLLGLPAPEGKRDE